MPTENANREIGVMVMQIAFERSGGFAGMILSTQVNTADLGAAESDQVCRLVQAASFFQLPKQVASGAQPDRFQYQLTISDGDRSHTINIGESAIPGTLRPLMDWLLEKARQ